MSFISIFIALLLEQVRPMGRKNPIRIWLPDLIHGVRRSFDAGQPWQAIWMGLLLVVVPALLVAAAQWFLASSFGWFAVVIWNIVILYVTLGFRQFSFHLTGIRKALDERDESLARQLLSEWRHLDTRQYAKGHIYQQVMQASALAAHRSVFGVFFWYAVLSAAGFGPAGAVLYRMTELAYRLFNRQGTESPGPSDALKSHFAILWAWMDWVPVRMTVMSFAMVGNFEEVVDRWRGLSAKNSVPSVAYNEQLLVVAAFAAVNIAAPVDTMVSPISKPTTVPLSEDTPGVTLMPGIEPSVGLNELNLLVGLVWRSLVLWMLLLALLSAANLLG